MNIPLRKGFKRLYFMLNHLKKVKITAIRSVNGKTRNRSDGINRFDSKENRNGDEKLDEHHRHHTHHNDMTNSEEIIKADRNQIDKHGKLVFESKRDEYKDEEKSVKDN